MTMRTKLAPITILLGVLCFHQCACAEPQDSFWLESQWTTTLTASHFHAVALSTNGQIIIGEFGRNILVFETNGTLVRSWATAVRDLDVSTNGLIFALVESALKVYDTTGSQVREWGLGFSGYGLGVGQNGIVYVCDTEGHRIVAFDFQGNFIRQWGTFGSLLGQFNRPHDVAVFPSGNVYVCDYGGARIQVFSPDGEFRRSAYAGYPVRIAVSPDEGVLYFSGCCHSSIGVFTPDGQLRYGVESGQIRTYRRSYLTTGVRPPNAVPLPRIDKVEQRAGTTFVDVDFNILDPDDSAVSVAAVAFINGQTSLASLIPMQTFEEGTGAAVGTNVATSVSHRLTWNAAADWSTNFVTAQVEILAKDNRGLMDFHFLTIPIPTNLPPLTISQFPVNDDDFLNAWVWLIASGNTNILLTNGTVMGLSGAYSGKTLTSNNGAVTTADGRSFLFSLLDVREATPDEYNRAKGSGVKWAPRVQLAGRPVSVNEFGFDTASSTVNNYWVVPLP